MKALMILVIGFNPAVVERIEFSTLEECRKSLTLVWQQYQSYDEWSRNLVREPKQLGGDVTVLPATGPAIPVMLPYCVMIE